MLQYLPLLHNLYPNYFLTHIKTFASTLFVPLYTLLYIGYMIKAIFFDIDGTLVSFKTHTIPENTRKALHLLKQKGIKVFIATGRPRMLMLDAIGNLEFDGYITLNGAHCATSDHQDIFRQGIPSEDIERLIAYHRTHPDIPFVFVPGNRWFITSIDKKVEEVARLIEIDTPPIEPIENARNEKVLQIMGYFDEIHEKELFDHVLLGCEPMRWHPLFTDIIAKGNSKSRGIDKILAHYGIDLQETMAFGDGGNDIPMLRHAGIGVAMGNAAPEVQAAADYVTTSVDDDGITHALRHFGLI